MGDISTEKWDFIKQTINRMEKTIAVDEKMLVIIADTLV